MVEYKKKESSGVAKAGLATAIGVGAAGALGLLNGGLLGNNGGILGNPVGYANAPAVTFAAAQAAGCGYVTEKEMCLIRENGAQGSTIARLEAEKYTDAHIVAALGPVYGELAKQNGEICDLKAAMAMETERRACGDERLLTYVDGNFVKAEKSINSRHINYHGCEPVIRPKHCCCGEE